ncbi:S41 family peptidase [Brevibacillus massiliensis]|jgi:carboxyl-terminal processing protease|uniref:S41 family peptidase n=1 Tax=Brevibacillus massiliensis TaxID=1118054 RepID=UPI000301984A|nr:S41 family peptidase [Brevibacillus massiliensis]
MKWNGRSVFVVALVCMVASSLLTLAVVRGGSASIGTQGAVATAGNLLSLGGSQSYPKEFSKLFDTYQIIKKNYVHDVPSEQLIEGAIEGMVGSLDDPYSSYMDPTAAEEFNTSLHSSFEGIGAEVTLKNGRVTIVSPFKGSPAELAGLRANDQILSVNGESLEGLDLQKAVSKIRGPKGTKATLKVLRPGMTEPITVVVIRDNIPIETVHQSIIQRGADKFGRIEITQFSADTAKHFFEELAQLEKENIKGLIIDVRGNPGGYLTAVREIAEQLIPEKKAIVKIEYGDKSREVEEYHSKVDAAKPYPIVVLTDGGSASASEILAGAMSESGGYKLVGEKTFGKGTVQNTVEMGDKSQLKLTIAKWLTPNGEWINKKGIEPDVAVSQPEYFKATQLPQDKVLEQDMTGVDVKNLQLILNGLKLSPGRNDGYFDAKTKAAVERFQKENNLPVTGKVDPATGAALQDALIEQIRDPKNDNQLQKALDVLQQEVKAKGK